MSEILNTAVIGGGMGGVYSAWRLAADDQTSVNASDVALFEMSDRLGGRLMTYHFPGMPNTVTELGGMRLVSTQDVMMGLSRRLRLELNQFPMGDDKNLVYVRRKRFKSHEFADPDVSPYNLPPWERGLTPAQAMSAAINKIVPGATEMTPKVLRAVCHSMEINGSPLRDYGFWSLLLEQLTIEGYDMSLVGGGYNTLLRNWNSADAIPWYLADFPVSIKYYAPKEGMEAFTNSLADEYKRSGGQLHMQHELVGFHKRDDGVLQLEFDTPEGRRTVAARRLVLGLPKWALKRLGEHAPDRPAPTEYFRDSRVNSLLSTVTSRNLFKFALAYSHPWWHMLNLRSGRSVTDLPLRQIYYFGTEGDQPNGRPENRNSYIDCSYSDGVSVGYWEGVRKTGPMFQTQANPFAKKQVPDELAVSAQMVKRASQQLAEVHGLPSIPEPYAAVCKDWNDAPYGGGWHTWNIGVNSAEAMPAVRQPDPDFPVYVCGESYSANQGWAEGAVQTAERMLQEHFGLSSPVWLGDDPDLGE